VKEAPARTRELEASGKLLSALKERAENEALLQWRSRYARCAAAGSAAGALAASA